MTTSSIFKPAALLVLSASALTTSVHAQKKGKLEEPAAFTTNCKACHLPQTDLVGPSLVEMSRLYPREKRDQFIQWCIDPGKKRANKAQMPSMAHIPKKDLVEIHKYILEASKGLKRVRRSKGDPYKDSEFYTKRPRVLRTFIPDTGPASVILALPTKQLHNIIWDTDQCALRYITTGKIDAYPYWKNNGNSEAKPGEKCFTENQPIFDPKHTQYLGYQLDEKGFPTFLYKVGNVTVTETYSVKNGSILRLLKSDSPLPKHQLKDSDTSKSIQRTIKQQGNTLSIEYSSKL